MAKIAFLGLGVMGYPMAGHLHAAGHRVTVYNRSVEKAQKWVAQHGGAMAATPKEAAAGADFVMACVGNDDDLRAVTLVKMALLLACKKAQFLWITRRFLPRLPKNCMRLENRKLLLSLMRRFRAVRPVRKMAPFPLCAAVISRPMTPQRL